MTSLERRRHGKEGKKWREMLAAITYWRPPPNGPGLETSITMFLSEQWWNIDGFLNGLPYKGWPVTLHPEDPECAARLMRKKEKRGGVEARTGRSQVLVSIFTLDRVLVVESSGSSRVICGCGDWTRPCGALAGDLESVEALRWKFAWEVKNVRLKFLRNEWLLDEKAERVHVCDLVITWLLSG